MLNSTFNQVKNANYFQITFLYLYSLFYKYLFINLFPLSLSKKNNNNNNNNNNKIPWYIINYKLIFMQYNDNPLPKNIAKSQ